MKKLSIPVLLFLMTAVAACNNSTEDKGNKEQATADSVAREVIDGHDVGMAKMGKLSKAQKEVNRLLDSVSRLPAQARTAAAPYKAKLDSLLKDLEYSDFAMNKWMNEFSYDSLKNNIKARIEYLSSEKIKVTTIKESILSGLEQADSLLHKKF
jgi:hypothetical protein